MRLKRRETLESINIDWPFTGYLLSKVTHPVKCSNSRIAPFRKRLCIIFFVNGKNQGIDSQQHLFSSSSLGRKAAWRNDLSAWRFFVCMREYSLINVSQETNPSPTNGRIYCLLCKNCEIAATRMVIDVSDVMKSLYGNFMFRSMNLKQHV